MHRGCPTRPRVRSRCVQSALSRVRSRAVCFGAVLLTTLSACGKDAASPDGTNVDAVHVTPATASLQVGSSLSLTASVLDASGEVIPTLQVAWTSEDSSVAQVSPSGVV